MRFPGALRGSGPVQSGEQAMRPGEVVASGESRMDAEALNVVFGRNDLYLRTDDGRLLAIRFSGKRTSTGDAAHADVCSGLPDEKQWRR